MLVFDASSIFEAIAKNRIELIVNAYTTDLARYELLNAVWKKCRLRRELREHECEKLAELLKRILSTMNTASADCHEQEVFKLAIELNLTVYDATYLLAAIKLGATLVTEDGNLREKASRYVRTGGLEDIQH